MNKKIPVGVLGATGSVGQRFVQLLDEHPWFKVAAVTGSARTVDSLFGDSCRWILPEPMPEGVRKLKVLPTLPVIPDLPLVFSALPSKIAQTVEPAYAQAGVMVCSNASAFRQDIDVPLLLPEVNPDHTSLLITQREKRGWSGGIVTNPNCTSTGFTIVLTALQKQFGVQRVFMVSMQAVSGAGYPGVASMDIMDNVIPYIAGEEEKVEWEPRKMLGVLNEGKFQLADMQLTVHCNRVPVSDGHTVCLSVELKNKPSADEVLAALVSYEPPQVSSDLPSSPKPVIKDLEQQARPQPRLDRMIGKGMTTVVGRLREDNLLDWKMVVLSHNTIRGAAGGSLYNAELLHKQGFL